MSENITEAVKKSYGAVARSGLSSEQDNIAGIAEAFGYSKEELASIPAEANMGLSCGNPLAMASIREGETVVDLGSGGGLDVFLAAQKVGATGRAIGIDMTKDMIELAEKNAKKAGLGNVEFHLAQIENMPLADDSVDCVISNCVLNLVADKEQAVAEIFRILKPGGRLAVSDIALRKELPPEIGTSIEAWSSCVSGAISIEENAAKLKAAGFSEVQVIDANSDLNAYKEGGTQGCCTPIGGEDGSCCGGTANAEDAAYHDQMGEIIDEIDFNEYAASVKILAIKA
jgi:SAM-dependent methyltransferase